MKVQTYNKEGKQMEKLNRSSILIFILLLGLSVELGYAQPPKPITLIYAEYRPETAIQCQVAKWWGQELEKRTGGQVKVNFYWAGSLVTIYNQMKALETGVAHVGEYMGGLDPAHAPFFNITILVPTPTDNPYAAAMAVRQMAELPEAKAELERNNVKFLSPSGTLGEYLYTRKPVTKLADIKGLKIRSWGPYAEMFKLWGATPVMMSPGEVYEALQRGVVDGDFVPMTNAAANRTYEHAKHFLMFIAGMNPAAPVVMNLKMWNSLPRDIQEIVKELSLGYTERWVKMWAEGESEAITKMKAAGCQFHEIGPEQKKELFEAAKPVWQEQVKILDKQGLPGKKLQETFFSYIRDWEKKGKK